MKIIPQRDQAVLKLIKEETTKDGLYLPEGGRERWIIESFGPYYGYGRILNPKLKVGDEVIFKFSGERFVAHDKTIYQIIDLENIIANIE